MVVNATTESDVSKAVKFAADHNLRLVIKNTGHDFLGRNIGFGSLSIWTHYIKGVEWLDNWKAIGSENDEPQSVVRYGSGNMWSEIYPGAYKHNKIVTGGTSGVSYINAMKSLA
jgi:hypothetical protein